MMTPLYPSAADPEALARALTGVERELPEPGWIEYLLDRIDLIVRWFLSLFDLIPSDLPFDPAVVVRLLFLVVGLALAFLVVRWLLARSAAAPVPTAIRAIEPVKPRVDWRRRMAQSLAAGDAPGALEALWWWLALVLVGPAANSSWTSRDLLERSRRADLAPTVDEMDRLAYGPVSPSTLDVERLRDSLQGDLG